MASLDGRTGFVGGQLPLRYMCFQLLDVIICCSAQDAADGSEPISSEASHLHTLAQTVAMPKTAWGAGVVMSRNES